MRYRSMVPFALVGALMSVNAVIAQDARVAEEVYELRAGKYDRLNWLRKLRLGTASFVNPSLVENAAVAYSYPAGNLSEEELQAAIDLWESGALAVATVSKDGSIVVKHQTAQGGTQPAAFFGGDNAVLVTPARVEAFGNASPIVSWEPTGPVSWPEAAPAE